MFEPEVHRLHPITIIINFFSLLKGWIIPLLIFYFSTDLKLSFKPKSEDFYPTLIMLAALLLIILLFLTISYIRWRKYIYWFEDNELRIKYGLFVKKKRYIPFERIQTLNYKEGILHRPFKLVKVEVETAGDNAGEAEVELTAIKKELADSIEVEMKKSKMPKTTTIDENGMEELVEVEEQMESPKKLLYRMTNKELILLASTSSSMGLLFSGIAAVASQFNELIPYEEIYGELQSLIRFGVLLIIIMVLGIILLAWGVAIAISYIMNYGFQLENQDGKLLISKGLLEKKRITLPLHRVQGIRIIENPIRQIFGYCRVVLDSAGSSGDDNEDSVVLLPFTKKTRALEVLAEQFPEYEWHQSYTKVPRKALLRYLLKPIYIWTIPIAASSYFIYPYGLFALVLLPIFLLIAYTQYRTAGFAIKNLQLTLVNRSLSKTTFVTSKKRIQAVTVNQSIFMEQKDLATSDIHIMSGDTGFTGRARLFELEDMKKLYEWYRPNDFISINDTKKKNRN